MTARYFRSASEWRKWLERSHTTVAELWVGLYKGDAGKTRMTYSEAVDHALCFGWIDGLRKSVDERRWRIRFTPRKPKSKWSQVNIRRATELLDLGLMRPEGVQAFRGRVQRSAQYSYEQTAKKEETRLRRLATLVRDSEQGERLKLGPLGKLVLGGRAEKQVQRQKRVLEKGKKMMGARNHQGDAAVLEELPGG